MARPIKRTVDYFPHQVNHGKTIFILERRWGNDGYAFWFRLLEMLGNADGHFIDCRDPADWEFLAAKTGLSSETASEILNCLSLLEAIDAQLWENRIIWCQHFVDGVADAYRKRKCPVPTREDAEQACFGQICEFPAEETQFPMVSGVGNTQTKLNEIKEEEKPLGEAAAPPPPDVPIGDIVALWVEMLPSLPKPDPTGKTLCSQIRARWKERRERRDMGWWREYFELISLSDFLCGRVKDFQATLIWATGPKNMEKVLQKGYGNGRSHQEGPGAAGAVSGRGTHADAVARADYSRGGDKLPTY